MNLDSIKPYAKAIVAFITPGVTGLLAAVQDASPGGSAVTGPEWVGIGAACILTGGAVFSVPNRDPQALHQAESVQPPESSVGDGLGEGVGDIADGIYGTPKPGDGPKPTGGYWGGV